MLSESNPHRSVWNAVLAASAVLTLVIAAGLAIVASPTWSSSELEVVHAVHAAPSGFLTLTALVINTGFGPGGAVLVVVITLGWMLLTTRSWRSTVRLGIVIAVPWALAEIVKVVVQRPRPDLGSGPVSSPMSFSFPSGHTAFAAALVCALILVLGHGKARAGWIWAGAAVVLITGWSRVYLGVHYPTDVLASMLFVPFAATATHRALGRWGPLTEPPSERTLT